MNNIHEEISRCIIKLLMKEPFFAHLLSGVVRTISDKIPTAAVGMRGGNVNLYINQQFFYCIKYQNTIKMRIIKNFISYT